MQGLNYASFEAAQGRARRGRANPGQPHRRRLGSTSNKGTGLSRPRTFRAWLFSNANLYRRR
eukprot:5071549-Pyramimonas_sp.AAC.1